MREIPKKKTNVMARLRRKRSKEAFQIGAGSYSGNIYRGRIQRMRGGGIGSLFSIIPKMGMKLISKLPSMGAKMLPKLGKRFLAKASRTAVTKGRKALTTAAKQLLTKKNLNKLMSSQGKKILNKGGKALLKAISKGGGKNQQVVVVEKEPRKKKRRKKQAKRMQRGAGQLKSLIQKTKYRKIKSARGNVFGD